MKKLILILSLFISLGASAQTLNSLPAGSKPYGNQLYITPDGLIIAGTTTIKYRVVGTKSYIDSLNTIYDNKYLPLTGGTVSGPILSSGRLVLGGALNNGGVTIKEGDIELAKFSYQDNQIEFFKNANFSQAVNSANLVTNKIDLNENSSGDGPVINFNRGANGNATFGYNGGNAFHLATQGSQKIIRFDGEDIYAYNQGSLIPFLKQGDALPLENSPNLTDNGRLDPIQLLTRDNETGNIGKLQLSSLLRSRNGIVDNFGYLELGGDYGAGGISLGNPQKAHLQLNDAQATIGHGTGGDGTPQSTLSTQTDGTDSYMQMYIVSSAGNQSGISFQSNDSGIKINDAINHRGLVGTELFTPVDDFDYLQRGSSDLRYLKLTGGDLTGDFSANNISTPESYFNQYETKLGNIKTFGNYSQSVISGFIFNPAESFGGESTGHGQLRYAPSQLGNGLYWATEADSYDFKKILVEGDAVSTTGGDVHGNLSIDGGYKIYGDLQGSNATLETVNLTGNARLATNDNSDAWNINTQSNGNLIFNNVNTGKSVNITEDGITKTNSLVITYNTGDDRKLSIETGASDPIDVIKYDSYDLYLGNTNANPVTGDIHIQGNGTDAIRINNNNEIALNSLIAPVTGYDLVVQDGGNYLRKVPASALGFATMGVSNSGNFTVDGYLKAGQASLDYNSGTNTVTLQNGSAGAINLNGYTVTASYNLEASNQITAPEIKANKFTLSAIQTAPSSATDSGNAGEIRVASDYIYVCIATNQWVRTALTTW